MPTVTPERITELEQARAAVHARNCHRGHLDPAPCVMCPTLSGLHAAMEILAERPRDARAARRALHDVVCMSSCPADDFDHSNRTQSRVVAALRKYLAKPVRPNS